MNLTCQLAVVIFIRSGSQAFEGEGIHNKWVSLASAIFLVQSWWPTIASTLTWNSVSWSISTEMFFYAMFPLLLVLVRKYTLIFALVSVLPLVVVWLIGLCAQIPPTGDVFSVTLDALAYFPPTRLLEFSLGIIACRVWQRSARGVEIDLWAATALEVGAVLMLIIWFSAGWPMISGGISSDSIVGRTWFAKCGSCLILAIFVAMMASGRGVVGKLLAFPILVHLGECSFALYMVHQIVMKVISLSYPALGTPLVVLGSCLVIAWLAYSSIERHGKLLIIRSSARLRGSFLAAG